MPFLRFDVICEEKNLSTFCLRHYYYLLHKHTANSSATYEIYIPAWFTHIRLTFTLTLSCLASTSMCVPVNKSDCCVNLFYSLISSCRVKSLEISKERNSLFLSFISSLDYVCYLFRRDMLLSSCTKCMYEPDACVYFSFDFFHYIFVLFKNIFVVFFFNSFVSLFHFVVFLLVPIFQIFWFWAVPSAGWLYCCCNFQCTATVAVGCFNTNTSKDNAHSNKQEHEQRTKERKTQARQLLVFLLCVYTYVSRV